MSLRTSANRYAKALFDVALEEKADLAQVDRDLQEVVGMIAGEPGPAHAASNRGTVTETQRASRSIEAIAEGDDAATPVTQAPGAARPQSRKLNLLPDLAEAYRERLLAHQNIVRAEVTSAAPLSPEKTKALEESLSQGDGQESGTVGQRRSRRCSAAWSRRSAARCTTAA